MELINNDTISPQSLNTMNECVSLFRSHTSESREWQHISSVIEVSSKMLHLMQLPVTKPETFGCSENIGVLTRFFNESVNFILTGKRTIRIEVWEGIINDATGYRDHTLIGNNGSIGSGMLGWTSKQMPPKVVSDSFKDRGIRNDLLSYAHRDVLHKWIHQPNGIDDMLYTLVLMAKIYTVYKNSSQQG